jgi:hypothetical protein
MGSGSIVLVDATYYEDIAGRLRGLLIRLCDRLLDNEQVVIMELIDANELGLALEYIADALCEDEQPLSADERADMLSLVTRMQMDDRVPQALAFCPDRAGSRACRNGQSYPSP